MRNLHNGLILGETSSYRDNVVILNPDQASDFAANILFALNDVLDLV